MKSRVQSMRESLNNPSENNLISKKLFLDCKTIYFIQ